MTDYTAQQYVETFLAVVFMDPAAAYAEMTVEAASLACRLDLPVSSSGRYRKGIWELVSGRSGSTI